MKNTGVVTTKLGHYIRCQRLRRGWSFTECGHAFGVDKATVWRLENSGTSPRMATIQRIAKAFRVKPSSVVKIMMS